MKIEVHIIQPLPVNRMNTDREGRPKTIPIGGYTRARISSQAQKRAARMYTHEYRLLDDDQRAWRTRHFTELLIERLLERGVETAEAEPLAARGLAAVRLGHKQERDKKTAELVNEYLIFYSDRELDGLSEVLIEYREEILAVQLPEAEVEAEQTNAQPSKKPRRASDTKRKIQSHFSKAVINDLKRIFTTNRTLELALYGRELADLPTGSVDGQVQVAHAFAVNNTLQTEDFFVTIDDRSEGAGMLGSVGITAPTLYRVAAVNLAQLAREVGSEAAAARGARAFLEAFTLAMPSGGQNSFFSMTTPSFVLFRRVMRGHALTLAPAFEEPVRPEGKRSLSEVAVERMDAYVRDVKRFFPQVERDLECCVNTTAYEYQNAKVMANLSKAIDYVLNGFGGT